MPLDDEMKVTNDFFNRLQNYLKNSCNFVLFCIALVIF